MSTPLPVVPVGRRAEFADLRAAVEALLAGRGRALIVEGEPGIGKSTMVRAAADEAAAQGCQFFWAACDELSRAFALVPLIDALGIRESADDPRRAAIARLLHGSPNEAGGADMVPAATELLLTLVDELCGDKPVVLVVDDLQWADPATVLAWSRLARTVAQVPLLLAGTMRPIPKRDDLLALRRLVGPQGRIVLSGLPQPDVRRLVEAAVGGAPGEKLSALAAGASGNPLYLTELCAELERSGRLARDGGRVELAEPAEVSDASRHIPLSVAVAGRLGFVSEPTREVLHTAALLGVDFSVTELAMVSGRRVPDLMPALDEAISAGVLDDDGGQGLAFRHPLIRSALYESVPAAVRAAWHADAGQALAAGGWPVDRVARQLLAAIGAGGRASSLDERWLAHWLSTAAVQLVWQAPQAAMPLLRAATEGPHTNPRLASWLADALYRTGDVGAAESVATRALAQAIDPDVLVELNWTLAQCMAVQGRSAESVETLEEALAIPRLDARQRARLLVLTARAHRNHGNVDAARQLAQTALSEARLVGDRLATGWALAVLAMVHVMVGEHAASLPLFDEAKAVAADDPSLGDLSLLLGINHAVALGELDRYGDAIGAAQDVWRLADQAGNAVRVAQAQSVLTELLFDTGQWDDALADAAAPPDMAPPEGPLGDSRNPVVECVRHGIAATIRLHRGDALGHDHLRAAEPYAEKISRRVVGALALARCLEREQADEPTAALDVLMRAFSDDNRELQESEELLTDAARLAMELGDDSIARRATVRAESLAEGSDVPRRRAAALHCRGLLDRKADLLVRAAAEYVAAGRPLPRAQALEAAGRILAEDGDMDAGRRHFTEAFDAYTALGAAWDLARLQARFRTYGIRRGPRATHRRARSGWDSLTTTEVRIANLVARGMSNPAIAAELFLSRRTVQTHVSHILNKLGLSSRIDIARQVSQRET